MFRFMQYLVAVNAGSNTLSFFQIDGDDATKLTMLGDPVDTLGDFPTTVAMSEDLNKGGLPPLGLYFPQRKY